MIVSEIGITVTRMSRAQPGLLILLNGEIFSFWSVLYSRNYTHFLRFMRSDIFVSNVNLSLRTLDHWYRY